MSLEEVKRRGRQLRSAHKEGGLLGMYGGLSLEDFTNQPHGYRTDTFIAVIPKPLTLLCYCAGCTFRGIPRSCKSYILRLNPTFIKKIQDILLW